MVFGGCAQAADFAVSLSMSQLWGYPRGRWASRAFLLPDDETRNEVKRFKRFRNRQLPNYPMVFHHFPQWHGYFCGTHIYSEPKFNCGHGKPILPKSRSPT